jgi:hypothetical protein
MSLGLELLRSNQYKKEGTIVLMTAAIQNRLLILKGLHLPENRIVGPWKEFVPVPHNVMFQEGGVCHQGTGGGLLHADEEFPLLDVDRPPQDSADGRNHFYFTYMCMPTIFSSEPALHLDEGLPGDSMLLPVEVVGVTVHQGDRLAEDAPLLLSGVEGIVLQLPAALLPHVGAAHQALRHLQSVPGGSLEVPQGDLAVHIGGDPPLLDRGLPLQWLENKGGL